ncbi:MAG: PAS domain-containing sensor histidine kinase [Anaerolineae bacterium]|nr:PAS domain-containing sensor histidine kinase [Anaerolineae bacterium]
MDDAPVGITVFQSGSIIYYNQTVLNIFGLNAEDYIKTLDEGQMSSMSISFLENMFSENQKGRLTPEMVEFWIEDGLHHKKRFLQNRFKIIRNDENQSGIVIYTSDITERKQAHEALRRSGERYRLVSELISDYAYSFRLEADGTMIPEWFTEAFTRITGFSTPEEIEAFSGLLSLIHQDGQALVATYDEGNAAGKTSVYEFRIVAKNGELKWIRDYSRSVWDEKAGRVVRIMGAAQDITTRKEAEEALKESEKRNNSVLEAIPDWIFRIHRNGTILDFRGGRYSNLFGFEGEFVNKKISEIFPPGMVEDLQGYIHQVLDEQPFFPFEFQWPLPDSVRYFEASLVKNSRTEVMMFTHDISERARLEKLKSEFINRASHELRTPLTGAILMSELIDMGGDEAEIKEYWGHLKGELQRQRNLVERLLTVGRLETGSLKLNPEAMDLQPVLIESQNAVYPQAKIAMVNIESNVSEHLPQVIGDRSGLEQVFTNLLNNAIKFSKEGGSVNVHCEIKDRGVSVFVQDSGVGIPAADQPHLFEGFFRAQNAIEKGIPGSGVGLYIVKSIVEELGGKVGVTSKLNEGTTFEVWLPIYTQDI